MKVVEEAVKSSEDDGYSAVIVDMVPVAMLDDVVLEVETVSGVKRHCLFPVMHSPLLQSESMLHG